MTRYGSPDSQAARVGRWLGRGAPGLSGGRSEAAGSVRLGKPLKSSKLSIGTVGAPGVDGPPGTARLSRGYRMYARPIGGTAQFATSGTCTWTQGGTGLRPVLNPTTDIEALPRKAVNGSTSVYGQGATSFPTFHPPDGTGWHGFSVSIQFSFTGRTANARWFVGMARGTSLVEPSGFTGTVGIGQDSTDSSPTFMHNDNTGTATKVSSGLAAPSNNLLYEVRVYASGLGGGYQVSYEEFTGGVRSAYSSYDTGTSTDVPVAGSNMFALMCTRATSPAVTTGIVFLGFYGELEPEGL